MSSISRRRFVQIAGSLAATAAYARPIAALRSEYEEGFATAFDGAQLYYRVYGDSDGPYVFMGPHFYASVRSTELEEQGLEDPTDLYIAGLQDRYRLILADYPRGTGKTGDALGLDYNPDIAVRDYEAIADAAGAERFAWVGYSYGGAMGVQMACRSGRRWGLLCGGFPPLNAPFARMVEIVDDMAESASANPQLMDLDEKVLWQSSGFYRPLVDWPERREISKLTIPRMVFIGTDDFGQGLPEEYRTPLADPIREVETELRSLGWEIHWISGAGHLEAVKPERALPIIQTFLQQNVA